MSINFNNPAKKFLTIPHSEIPYPNNFGNTGKHDTFDFVIITAPHAKCHSQTERDCDTVSGFAATVLYEMINTEKRLLIGDRVRLELDLNRPMARNNSFRKSLSHLLLSTSSNGYTNFLLLDIHSFSPLLDSHELFIIDNTPNNHPLLDDLVDFLRVKGMNATKYQGTPVNDIVLEALAFGFLSFIIEFNESLSEHRIQHICSLVSTWLNTL